jgi:hypothetical protein
MVRKKRCIYRKKIPVQTSKISPNISPFYVVNPSVGTALKIL